MDRKRWLEVGIVCVLFLLLAAYAEKSEKVLQDDHILEREKEGGSDRSVELILDAGDLLEDYEYQVSIPASGVTGEQAKEYFTQAKEEIDESFYDSGEQPEHVTTAVHLRNSYVEGLVKAEWSFDRSDIVDADGNLEEDEIPEDGVAVQACASLRCGEEKEEYVFSFMVYPRALTDREQFLLDLRNALTEEGEKKEPHPLFSRNLSMEFHCNGGRKKKTWC